MESKQRPTGARRRLKKTPSPTAVGKGVPAARWTRGQQFGAVYFSFVKMIVPEAANMPPTPWQTLILAPSTWAGAMPRI